MQVLESGLRKIRRKGKVNKWKEYSGLSEEWQKTSIRSTAIHFELFLIKEVWASKGENYAKYRLDESRHKRILADSFKIQIISKKKIEHVT